MRDSTGINADKRQPIDPAMPSDQKKQIQGTRFAKGAACPAQATKVNAFARQNPAKVQEWLTPAQREQLKGAK